MRRERLRPAYSAADLAAIYPEPHRSTRWADHNVRVAVTIGLAHGWDDLSSIADLSCGDARIAQTIAVEHGIDTVTLGDIAPGYEFCGPIEETIEQIEPVDLFVCSETIEHLDRPESVLVQIRANAARLLLSTPVEAWNDRGNLEHYWAWDREAVEAMLQDAGFRIAAYCALDLRPGWSPYCFGIWAAT
jgi:hypothetical protein